MKQIRLHIGMIAVLLTFMLTACTDCIVDNETSSNEAEDGYYTAHFNIAIPSFEKQTATRSTVYMNEGIRSKENLKLFCFDNEGQFLGFGNIKDNFNPIKGFYRDNDGNYWTTSKNKIEQDSTTVSGGDINGDGSSELRDFKAEIPNKTSRIHLVANATEQYNSLKDKDGHDDQWKWVGMHENMLMTTFETFHTEQQEVMTRYWGYIKRDTPNQLKEYLTNTDKQKDYIIHLIRDRAKISAVWSDAAKKANPNLKSSDFGISVFNGVQYGTIAPFNRDCLKFDDTTGGKDWTWNPTYITPSVSTKRLKGSDGQMYNPTAAFEESNLPTDPAKVTIRYNGKFYFIYLQDKNNKPYAIKRNYEYRIIIDKLDESYGKGSSEEAIKGAPVNNPWIRVEQYIPGVKDGNYELAINEGTYQTTNAASGSEQFIEFTYKGDDAADKKPTDFVALWTENLSFGTAAAPVVTSYDYNEASKTGTGTIKYKLDTVDKTWREGIIHLIDKVHGLNRNIHLYSVSEASYDFQLNSEGDFTITIPKDYPDELVPVNFKIASNDIYPEDWKVEIGDTQAETEGKCKTGSWFTYKAEERKYTYTFKLRNVRSNAKKVCFWLKADNFNQGKAKKFEFTYQ
ncbi:hypothetical protein V7T18_04410 [Segatella copri]|uniref:hypothetical protein n=1 Tax=Segatella copri TaxID=165179 RepID=UPI002FF1FD5B